MSHAFSFHAITKRFGAVTANDSVSFSVETGSIHGVVGENGAGKSTIMKVLYGMYHPEGGTLSVKGKEERIRDPLHAISLGIGMVHQHFMLVPTLRVWENVVLGSEPTLLKTNVSETLAKLDKIQKDFGFSLDLNAIVETLPVGLQQQVEILKLLYRNAEILILDEPTAVLTPQEVVRLFDQLRTLKEKNKTIVLITHKLKEILSFTENVTVMRQGKVVETIATKSLTEASLAEKIIGRKRAHLPNRSSHATKSATLSVEGVSLTSDKKEKLRNISFQVHPGEIVGIAGIEGNGQHELIEALSNVNRTYKGNITFKNDVIKNVQTYTLKQKGLSLVPPDRHHEAVVLEFSVTENAILGHHREEAFTEGHRLCYKKLGAYTEKLLDTFDVRPRNGALPISALSGGNQQKLVVGRETNSHVELLIAAHPTRGVDIGAIEFIHSHFLRLREKGAAILLFSSELDEILALSDRILVMYHGEIVGEVKKENASETQLGLWMTGATK